VLENSKPASCRWRLEIDQNNRQQEVEEV